MDPRHIIIFENYLQLEKRHFEILEELENSNFDINKLKASSKEKLQQVFHLIKYLNPFASAFVSTEHYINFIKQANLGLHLPIINKYHIAISAMICRDKQIPYILIPKDLCDTEPFFSFYSGGRCSKPVRRDLLTLFLIMNSSLCDKIKVNESCQS